jgi:hypothetical protein
MQTIFENSIPYCLVQHDPRVMGPIITRFPRLLSTAISLSTTSQTIGGQRGGDRVTVIR